MSPHKFAIGEFQGGLFTSELSFTAVYCGHDKQLQPAAELEPRSTGERSKKELLDRG